MLVWSTGAVCLIACNTANNRPLSVGFSADSNSIVFKQIDPAGLQLLRQELPADSAFSTLIRVLEKDRGEDTERNIAGIFSVTDSSIVFIPEHTFSKGKDYLVVSYLNARFATAGMLLKGKMDHQLKPEEYLLSY
ncbi:hypothetical protein SAMN04488084_1033 [Pedobacter antarcticus]|nr:hypothetical protein SAMN04488084_1033 [Pedobacter antarcticus]